MTLFVQTMGQGLHDGLDALNATARMLKGVPLYKEPLRVLLQQHRAAGFVGFDSLALRVMPDVLSPVEKVGMAAAVIWGTPTHYKSLRVSEREAVWAATDKLWPKGAITSANDNDADGSSEGGTPPTAPAPTPSVMPHVDDFDLIEDNDDEEPSAPRFG